MYIPASYRVFQYAGWVWGWIKLSWVGLDQWQRTWRNEPLASRGSTRWLCLLSFAQGSVCACTTRHGAAATVLFPHTLNILGIPGSSYSKWLRKIVGLSYWFERQRSEKQIVVQPRSTC